MIHSEFDSLACCNYASYSPQRSSCNTMGIGFRASSTYHRTRINIDRSLFVAIRQTCENSFGHSVASISSRRAFNPVRGSSVPLT